MKIRFQIEQAYYVWYRLSVKHYIYQSKFVLKILNNQYNKCRIWASEVSEDIKIYEWKESIMLSNRCS